MRHDLTDASPVSPEAALADDPELWLVLANLSVWAAAHPCECEALCTCDEPGPS